MVFHILLFVVKVHGSYSRFSLLIIMNYFMNYISLSYGTITCMYIVKSTKIISSPKCKLFTSFLIPLEQN